MNQIASAAILIGNRIIVPATLSVSPITPLPPLVVVVVVVVVV